MDLGNLLRDVYNLVIGLAYKIGDIWHWLSTNQKLGLKLFGFTIGFTIRPLDYLLGLVGTLLFAWFVKGLIPGA